jgi:pyruvate,water dikinase
MHRNARLPRLPETDGVQSFPKNVIAPLSHFKTNESANFIGRHVYEPKEQNPMIGFRGASRYYNPP